MVTEQKQNKTNDDISEMNKKLPGGGKRLPILQLQHVKSGKILLVGYSDIVKNDN